MIGIIIAGGFGTRLRPLTYARPKHLLPVANRPFLEYQVALLRRHGIEQVVFATNYFADRIEAHFGEGAGFGVAMHYAHEQEPLGTGGAIRNAADVFPGQRALVLNGDILTDFDLGAVLRFHEERGAAATIALRAVERPHAFGALDTASDGRVSAWREPTEAEKRAVAANPGSPTGERDYINAGVYVLEPEVVGAIPTGRPVSIERETYPALIASGAPVYGIAPEGFWLDMGHPEQYLRATAAVLTGQVRTDVPFRQFGDAAHIAEDASCDAATSLGRNVRVGSGSRLSGCILMDGATVGANVTLAGVIADEGAEIGDEAVARPGVVLGAGAVIPRGTRL